MLSLLLLASAIGIADDPQSPAPADLLEILQTALADVIERAEPSVVAIARLKSDSGETLAIRNPGRPSSAGAVGEAVRLADPNAISFDYGSGVIIGDQGEILTAYHVVKGAAKLYVRAPGGLNFYAEIIAADPRSDLAVIVPIPPSQVEFAKRFRPMPLGDASRTRKGAFLIALGNPFNAARTDGRPSASWGILANLARQIVAPTTDANLNPVVKSFRHYPTLFQLDSKLNLGMSGGAVVNMKGELVGITTAAADVQSFDAQAGYAIPLDALGRRVVDRLKEGREVEYGFIGITLEGPPDPPNQVKGVAANTPANDADLRAGDQILAVGDAKVDPIEGSLNLALSLAPVGEEVPLKILRRGEILETKVRLSKFPVEGEVIATTRPTAWRGLRVDFSSVLNNTTFNTTVLEAMSKGGVAVVGVEPNSAAEVAGLKPGQIVTSVDGKRVRTPEEFRALLKGREGPVRIQTESREFTVR